MKPGIMLQFPLLFILLLTISAEGFFFEYPKKALLEFLQSLKEKKEAKKKPHDIHHYHIHYYSPKLHVISEVPSKAPSKYDLDKTHDDHLLSLGWFNNEYKYTPHPKVTISSSSYDLWDHVRRPTSWDHGETDLSETFDHSENQGIIVQVPVNQHVTIGHPKKSSLLASFFHKFADSKTSIHF